MVITSPEDQVLFKKMEFHYVMLKNMASQRYEQYFCEAEACSKSFGRWNSLKRHLKIHSDEREYVCDAEGCSKAYSNTSSESQLAKQIF